MAGVIESQIFWSISRSRWPLPYGTIGIHSSCGTNLMSNHHIIIISNLPTWLKDIGCVCPFLFPFETRQLLFYVTSFDRDRALLRLLDAAPELGVTDTQVNSCSHVNRKQEFSSFLSWYQERVTPDLDRKKRVISRETILKQGEQLMSELASSRSLLGS